MKLVASLIVHNERSRYLQDCVDHLLGFCDEVAIVDDGSTDGTHGHFYNQAHVYCCNTAHRFYQHEGRARQFLVDWTLTREPTHVLSIDADEFVSDGTALRARLEAQPDVPTWTLDITEIWKVDDGHLYAREDGGWRTHPLSCLWKAPPPGITFSMLNRKLACRRVPQEVLSRPAKASGADLLHFGWTDKATRKQRYDRYTMHDGGKFHASAHLRSIMVSDQRVRFRALPWPDGPVYAKLRDRLTGGTA